MKNQHDIIWLDRTDSTNDEARRRISDLDNLSVLSARWQSSGRGQRGNVWSAAPGENLTFSVVMKFDGGQLPQTRAIDQFVISEIAALSVVDLLSGYGIEARIKWPNDIYVGNRKICGILIENSLKGLMLSTSIVGIGLNVNQRVFDPSLPNPTSMALCLAEAHEKICLETLMERFIDIMKAYCTRYLNITGGYVRLRKLYLAQLWRLDEPAEFLDKRTSGKSSDPSGTFRRFTGVIRGVSDPGNLMVEDCGSGQTIEFAFKEIGYVID